MQRSPLFPSITLRVKMKFLEGHSKKKKNKIKKQIEGYYGKREAPTTPHHASNLWVSAMKMWGVVSASLFCVMMTRKTTTPPLLLLPPPPNQLTTLTSILFTPKILVRFHTIRNLFNRASITKNLAKLPIQRLCGCHLYLMMMLCFIKGKSSSDAAMRVL